MSLGFLRTLVDYFLLDVCHVLQASAMQVVVHDINHEIMARAGLQSIGVASGMGRGGVSRALCIIPGTLLSSLKASLYIA